MKVLWLSANKLGYELLKTAVKVDGFELLGIVTLRPGSSTIMYDGVPADRWQEFGVPVHQVSNINDEENVIRSLCPDLIIVCGWRQLVGEDIMKLPKNGIIGFHPTLLPYGRGPAPIINTLLKGLTRSGLTMFYLGKGLDDGDLIGQAGIKIEPQDHAQDVYDKTIKAAKRLIKKYLPLVLSGRAPRVPQDNSRAVVFDKPVLENNRIDLSKESLEEAYQKIKALSKPYRGAYIEKDGKRLVIWRAELLEPK